MEFGNKIIKSIDYFGIMNGFFFRNFSALKFHHHISYPPHMKFWLYISEISWFFVLSCAVPLLIGGSQYIVLIVFLSNK